MKSMVCWIGGTGKPIKNCHIICSDSLDGSQVFPSYVTRKDAVVKTGALARLKEIRARKQLEAHKR
jgi:hypothetical protein